MARRIGYVFLCTVPLLDVFVVAPRALRVPGVYQAVGAVLFAAIVVAVWSLVRRVSESGAEQGQRLALAGALLIAPYALVSLLWVGLGPPWMATRPENLMRYLVLLAGGIAVTGGFVVLWDALSDAGARVHSTLGFAAGITAGTAYLVWTSLEVGTYVAAVRDGQVSATIAALNEVFDILLTAGCALTYLATAAFAASCGRAGLLGRGAARAYVLANVALLLFLIVRGLSFPDPRAGSTPWYLSPGFIAGIPAVPWILPFLLGVVLLRRAGDGRA